MVFEVSICMFQFAIPGRNKLPVVDLTVTGYPANGAQSPEREELYNTKIAGGVLRYSKFHDLIFVDLH